MPDLYSNLREIAIPTLRDMFSRNVGKAGTCMHHSGSFWKICFENRKILKDQSGLANTLRRILSILHISLRESDNTNVFDMIANTGRVFYIVVEFICTPNGIVFPFENARTYITSSDKIKNHHHSWAVVGM